MEIITKQFVINVIKCIFDVLDIMSANLAGQWSGNSCCCL